MLYISTIGPSRYYEDEGIIHKYISMLENGKIYVLIECGIVSSHAEIRLGGYMILCIDSIGSLMHHHRTFGLVTNYTCLTTIFNTLTGDFCTVDDRFYTIVYYIN